MEISVEHIYGPTISKLHREGWRVTVPVGWPDMPVARLRNHRRTSGVVMKKDMPSVGEAMRDFERITGYDVIADVGHCGGWIYVFWWDDPNMPGGKNYAAGWDCGKHLYGIWRRTPRECLEALNHKN